MKVGLVVMDENPADALRIVRAAGRAGVHSLWTIDYYNRSSLTRAAAFAAVSGDGIVGASVTLELIRRLLAHRSGPFRYQGRFDRIEMARYDRTALPDSVTILAAGVGEHMVTAAGECADGFVGHTIASAGYLRGIARPLLAKGAARASRDAAQLRMTTQIVASADADPRRAPGRCGPGRFLLHAEGV